MIEKVQDLLQEFENKQAAGKVETFHVKVIPNGLLVEPHPADGEELKTVDLTPELLYTLQIFFSDIDGITYNSYDYRMLKSLLNAHATLERMALKTGNSNNP
ncbi:hypothetical protein K3G39_16425 [Pontibacter sp. HSC-14F20]|uniref:hypothetical protein n=1 Tax=Pontibacter sp. HSC-14F20 TaxID=2864136 RepID=UPI001C72E595|nr:hypothetical protein [Pontibacter sp. HSC-14F20]MBX0334828.1 hypothetical protein [Pontibacter sp. HSC-14F20]